jgi:hypothetical protein
MEDLIDLRANEDEDYYSLSIKYVAKVTGLVEQNSESLLVREYLQESYPTEEEIELTSLLITGLLILDSKVEDLIMKETSV